MTDRCSTFAEQLAAGEPFDDAARAHLAACSDCRDLLATLEQADRGLAALPAIEPSDALIARVLAVAGTAAAPVAPSARRRWLTHPSVVGPLAATLLLAVIGGLAIPNLLNSISRGRDKRSRSDMVYLERPVEGQERTGAAAGKKRPEPPSAPPPPATEPADLGLVAFAAPRESLVDKNELAPGRENLPAAPEFDGEPTASDAKEQDSRGWAQAHDDAREESSIVARKQAKDDADHLAPESKLSAGSEAERQRVDLVVGADEPATGKRAGEKVADFRDQAAGDTAVEAATRFLAERAVVEDLRFQEPRGYWRNSYVPGDPETRFLAARLAELDPVSPALAVKPWPQPFDAPDPAALGVYLRADRAAIEGKSRTLIEVGLKGAPARAARRGDAGVAVVLDLRSAPDSPTQAAMRAVLIELARQRQADDRFTLIVAGVPGAPVVDPGEFRNGPLAVALEQAFARRAGAVPELDLAAAVERALRAVGGADDPRAPLGSASVVLVTASGLGTELERIARLAHTGAVNGIATSVVALGGAVPSGEVQRLALAGQGRRHLLERPDQARTVVARELHATAGTVARAVRLRIRLAEGVRLVGVIGSRRLSNADAKRVREAEQSIDRRLAQALGIAADRGEDEDGIQIVIPAFHAGDEHAILLDVVVERPGPVAEVTVRYKDLRRLENAVSRASLALPAGTVAPGPLERNVTRNLLAARVVELLRAAERRVREGDASAAATELAHGAELVRGLATAVPGWSDAPELKAEASLLEGFAHELGQGPPPARLPILADSLRLAALHKISPPFEQP